MVFNISSGNYSKIISICSRDRYITSIVTSTINGVFSPIALITNALIAIVIWRTPSLRNPSNFMLVGLASVDFTTGLLLQPIFIISHISYLTCSTSTRLYIEILLSFMIVCSGSAFIVIAGVSLEMLLALEFHLRYTSIVTNTRIGIFLISTWVGCAIVVAIHRVFPEEKTFNYPAIPFISLCIIITFISHIRIFLTVQRHRRQIASQRVIVENGEDRTRMRRIADETKRAINLATIIGLYCFFYSPQLILQLHNFVNNKQNNGLKEGFAWTETIMFLRASVNPLVWFYKKTELRIYLKNMWASLCH